MAKIAIFHHHPYCSDDCTEGMVKALGNDHQITLFNGNDITEEFLKQFDCIAFPGGIGDADKFNELFHWRKALLINNYVNNGGKYLGICMGAYWAGHWYFDLLKDVEPVQYIKQSSAIVKRSYGTTVPVNWGSQTEFMYFYDGCCFTGDLSNTNVIATYPSLEPAAIIQGNLGLIGPHPESTQHWFKQFKNMQAYWHDNRHHELLKDFVERLLNEPL